MRKPETEDHYSNEDKIYTYLIIDTCDNLEKTLRNLELVESNGRVTLERPIEDEDVDYLLNIMENEGFRNIKQLFINPINLSTEAWGKLSMYARTYPEYFPELYFIDDNGKEISQIEVDLLKAM